MSDQAGEIIVDACQLRRWSGQFRRMAKQLEFSGKPGGIDMLLTAACLMDARAALLEPDESKVLN